MVTCSNGSIVGVPASEIFAELFAYSKESKMLLLAEFLTARCVSHHVCSKVEHGVW